MKKEKIIKEVGKPILKPLGITQGVFLLGFLFSPIIWIWLGWSIAWKTGLTGLIGTLLIYMIYSSVKRTTTKSVNESLQELEDKKQTQQETITKSVYYNMLHDILKKKAEKKINRKY